MTPLEEKLRAAFRAKADEIRPDAPPLRLPARRRRSLFLAYGGGEKTGAPAQRAWPGWIAPAVCAVLVVGVIAVSAVAFRGGRLLPSSPARAPAVHAIPAPSPSSYLGVFEAGSPPSYQPVEDFARAAGREPNLVGYISGWAQPFAASYAQTIRKHGAIMIVQIDPANASVAGIAAGDYDVYLRLYADSVRNFGHSVIIGFGHEMNAPWYSWGYGHVQPSVFVAAWRHIVTLFRSQGADNVTWLWTINADVPGTGPVASWWPGASYVTWVGIDGYYTKPSDTFHSVFVPTIDQVRAFARKPILLSETAVAPDARQYASIINLFQGIAQYATLGLVWSDIDQHGGPDHQDWRLEGNPAAEAAVRLGVAGLTLARS
jgi:mannan endo-1,4-beta-mannosidase